MRHGGPGHVDGLAGGQPHRVRTVVGAPEPLRLGDELAVRVRRARVEDGAARRHRHRADRPLGADRERQRPVGHVEAVQVVVVRLPLAEVSGRDDEEGAAVRVPDRGAERAGAARQRGPDRLRVPVGDVHDHDLLRLVEQVARAVDVEVEARDQARGLGGRGGTSVLVAGHRGAVATWLGEAGRDGDAGRVRRPHGRAGTERQRGDDARLTAVDRRDGELSALRAVLVGHDAQERERPAVR